MKRVLYVLLMILLSVAAHGGSITIISPNGGENLIMGTTTPILYSRSGLTNPIRITLWRNGVKLGVIADNVPANGVFSWPVGSYDHGRRVVTSGAGFTIKIKEQGMMVSDTSDESFYIQPTGWSPTRSRSTGGIEIFQPGNDAELEVGQARIIKWRTPEGSEGSREPIMLTLWQLSQPRFKIIGRITNQPGENQHTWVINRVNIFEPGRYLICIHLADQSEKLAEGPRVRINLPDRSGSEQNVNNDLEIGPVTPDHIFVQKVSSYGGGSSARDKFRFRVNLKIRNNSWSPGHLPQPVISNLWCKYTLYNRTVMKDGQRGSWAVHTDPGGRHIGEFQVGPFESRRPGEWTTCTVAFSCFLLEENFLEKYDFTRQYYLEFELLTPDSLNDPNLDNNKIRSSIFGYPRPGNAVIE